MTLINDNSNFDSDHNKHRETKTDAENFLSPVSSIVKRAFQQSITVFDHFYPLASTLFPLALMSSNMELK